MIRRLRDGFSRVLLQSRLYFHWSVRFSQNGRYVALSEDSEEGQLKILNVRMGKCLAWHKGHVGAVEGLVFTPDGKGLLSVSWDSTVIYWDVSWLKSTYDGQKGAQNLTGGLKEISRFVGHKVASITQSILPAP